MTCCCATGFPPGAKKFPICLDAPPAGAASQCAHTLALFRDSDVHEKMEASIASQAFAHLCIGGYLVSSNNSDFCWQGSRWPASRSRQSPSWSLARSWRMERLGMGLVGGTPGHRHRRRYNSSPPMLVSVLWLLPLSLPLRLGLLDPYFRRRAALSSERVGASTVWRLSITGPETLLRPRVRGTARLYPDFKFDWRSNPNSSLIPSLQPGLVSALNDRAFFVSDSPKK
jgi:hypothetical protein